MLTQKSMLINGKYIENLIDGYTTTNVSGREMIDVEHDAVTIGQSNGSVYKGKRYPSRTLTVSFVIEGGERSILSKKLDILNSILDVENATIIFRDEPDRYYIGTREGTANATISLGVVIGSFNIFCPDPFKYSVEEYEVEPVDIEQVDAEGNTVVNKAFLVDYKGNYKSFPTLEANFYGENDVRDDGETPNTLTGNGDCGYVSFYNTREAIIQIGDPDETDGADLDMSQTLTSQDFKTSTSWGTETQENWPLNVALTTYYNNVQAGSLKEVQSSISLSVNSKEYYLTPDSYGSGAAWHGPTITRTLPEDASGVTGAANFQLAYQQKLATAEGSSGNKQYGAFQAMCVNKNGDTRKIVAGVTIVKNKGGGTAGILMLYLNGKTVHSQSIDLSYYNEYFGNNCPANKSPDGKSRGTKKWSYITKSGNNVTFNVGGLVLKFTCGDEGFAELETHEVTFGFAQSKTATPLSCNGLYYAKFIKSHCDTWRDIPNKFSTNDVLIVDCNTGKILLNDLSTPGLGALGNGWEDFYLVPGENLIGFSYSEWVNEAYAPKFKMRYREVFL